MESEKKLSDEELLFLQWWTIEDGNRPEKYNEEQCRNAFLAGIRYERAYKQGHYKRLKIKRFLCKIKKFWPIPGWPQEWSIKNVNP